MSVATTADRLYAERFDRAPTEEPWRSRWCRIETQHAAALHVGERGNWRALIVAAKLADARYAVECEWRRDAVRRAVAALMGREP